ncbi:NAD(P)/FAD-dependent oxidoreductase [Actinomadura sp. WMMB 499]|uniref:NAD(P)/FAD-dependent oxidoreductase n=1 Tax=Actinomadura sp. WMMB 499 TaxID=1219491 RepID=UPI00124711FB|nr:FAD-dependent oxidoreductase [Actinomadura sp. WMMB 499]QFG25027.1 pyridine nucleotide-disulfide oxidoreductase [Actinomadura sp. WMMB 499]
MIRSVLVVGAGQAAAVAVRTLRRRGFDGRVTLVGEESEAPYQRPPLSKEHLAGDQGRDELYLLTPEWCAANAVDLRTGTRVTAIRAADRAVEYAGGGTETADAVLIATGGSPRRLPGVEGERVRHLRTLADADRLRAGLRPGARVIVIGAGFVGSEVASTARGLGAEVTVIERAGQPLAGALGEPMGDTLAALQRDAGVELRTGEKVESYRETAGAALVTTSGGATVEGDLVVVGAGMVPASAPAAGPGSRVEIAADGGIVVDERCRTGQDGVYAAGDVTTFHHPLFGRRIRAEHFDNANAQGMVAAKNILGKTAAHTASPWFWSDQFGRNLQYTGHPAGTDRLVLRGRVEDFDFVAYYLAGGVLRAAFGMDRGADIAVARELIAARSAPDPDVLRDEDADLTELLG